MVCRDQCFIRVVRSERVQGCYSFERCWRVRVCVGRRRCSFVARETEEREKELQEMRTSSSCVLEGQTVGEQTLIKNTEKLLAGTNPNTFEAPTCIRYEPGQRLAAHFDANRGAQIEDAERVDKR